MPTFDFKLKQTFDGVSTGGTGTGTTGRKVQLFSQQGAGFTNLYYNNKGEHPFITDFGGKRTSVSTFTQGVTGGNSATDFGARISPVTDEIYLSYRIRFSDGFNFNGPGDWWNGKLPGFRGKPSIPASENGSVNNNGPVIYPNWRGSRNYFWVVYHHGTISTGNGFGDSMGKGSWGPTINTGEWIDIDMRVVMNTNGSANGILQIWIKGVLITQATVSNAILRKATSVQSLEEFVYITSTDWDTVIPQTQQLYIADIHIWKYDNAYLAANTSVKRGFQLWTSSDDFISPLREETIPINRYDKGTVIKIADIQNGVLTRRASNSIWWNGSENSGPGGTTVSVVAESPAWGLGGTGLKSVKNTLNVTPPNTKAGIRHFFEDIAPANRASHIQENWYYIPQLITNVGWGVMLSQWKQNTQNWVSGANYWYSHANAGVYINLRSGANFLSAGTLRQFWRSGGTGTSGSHPTKNVPIGQWFGVKSRYTQSSPGVANGRFETWQIDLDGTHHLVADHQNVITWWDQDQDGYIATGWEGEALRAGPALYGEGLSPNVVTSYIGKSELYLPATEFVPQIPLGSTLITLISNITANSVNLYFTYSSNDQTGFQYRLGNGNAVNISSSPILISGLIPSREYSVQVRAINAQGFGTWSNAVSFNTLALPIDSSDLPIVLNAGTFRFPASGIVATIPQPTPDPEPEPEPNPEIPKLDVKRIFISPAPQIRNQSLSESSVLINGRLTDNISRNTSQFALDRGPLSEFYTESTSIIPAPGYFSGRYVLDLHKPKASSTGNWAIRSEDFVQNNTLLRTGLNIKYTASFLVDESYDLTHNMANIVYQWHAGSGSPVNVISIVGSRWVISVRSADDSATGLTFFDVGPVVKGTWVNFQIWYKFSNILTGIDKGRVTVWKDGMIATCHNPVTGAPWIVPTSNQSGISNFNILYPAKGRLPLVVGGASKLDYFGKTSRADNTSKYPKWGGGYISGMSNFYNSSGVPLNTSNPGGSFYINPSWRYKTVYVSNLRWCVESGLDWHSYRALDLLGQNPIEVFPAYVSEGTQAFVQQP